MMNNTEKYNSIIKRILYALDVGGYRLPSLSNVDLEEFGCFIGSKENYKNTFGLYKEDDETIIVYMINKHGIKRILYKGDNEEIAARMVAGLIGRTKLTQSMESRVGEEKKAPSKLKKSLLEVANESVVPYIQAFLEKLGHQKLSDNAYGAGVFLIIVFVVIIVLILETIGIFKIFNFDLVR